MNARNQKILVGAAILAIAIPAVGFAAKGTIQGPLGGYHHSRQMNGSGSESAEFSKGPRGWNEMGPMMGDGLGETRMLSNEKVRAALTASGVVLPSTDEVKAFQDQLKTAREAEAKLSDADKAELKKMREATMEQMRKIQEDAAKSERDYLRTKGIALPTEETITKFGDVAKKAGEVLRSMAPKFDKNEGQGGKRGQHGMMGRFGKGQMSQDAENSESGSVGK